MGNIFFCCLGVCGRRRRRSNVLATEATPLQPPEVAAASYQSLCLDSNLYTAGDCSSPTGAMSEPYDHQPHPYTSVEHKKADTIRNDTNLRKETLSLEPDRVNPGRLLVAFTFDAAVSGRITIVFFAKEEAEFQLTATKEDTLAPIITFEFEKGLGQKFIQPSGTGVDLSVFEDSELFKEPNTYIFPLAIKMEEAVDSGSKQITLVTYVNEKGEIKPSVIKQLLWVDGTRFELLDIYGIGDTVVGGCNEDARDCVICLSEPRDTTLLPCRHMCMCDGCAKEVRFQRNLLCPVCRQPVERLLKIQLNE
ncbi:unnamed protein product [Eruca vesicaria subsp. sativa]|uniref:RING-type E3 ubiquitin transferase n=1 Tax=Eruca vesicaria subsp. sativa TaxID=29727 RepID=A0ABC8LA44_ERUVS|nr:unnamed protein product [Eruca vesicaria subsp. sativa]